jgi:RND superfamily putative drug exporter
MIIAIIWGLSTDYEVFLVSRMVEARERGMSTTEAIRIGTATTGRLISAAALVLAVVAGSFAFSDLVMMKYLAFGLLIALLLDATVIRMFLVPSIMKLLGDDCWWAPRWMKRIQERLGLGETELPDERRRPAVREPAENPEALVGAGAPVSPRSTARPRPPHDPTHPAAEGASRPGAAARTAVPRTNPPSSAGTTRMPTGRTPADEPQTTRLSTAKSAVRNVVSNAAAATRAAAAPPAPRPPREEREIESWLGELRGTDAPAGQPAPPPARGTEGGGPRQKAGEGRPSTASTRAMPEQVPPPEHAPTRTPGTGGRRRRPDPDPGNEPTTAIPAPEDADPTTAIPALGTPAEDRGRPQAQDPETATDKLNARDEGEQPKRRGGGMSAQDLLRREGRL